MGLGRYVLLRMGNAVVVLILTIFIISLMFNASAEKQLRARISEEVKGMLMADPILARQLSANETALREWMNAEKEMRYERYGLDKPLLSRVFMRSIATIKLDFGKSHTLLSRSGTRDVSTIILESIPRTILLFTTATIVVVIMGLFLGLKAAQRSGSLLDRTISVLALISYSLPTWWTGMLFILLFSYYLGIVPSGGMVTIPPPEGAIARVLDIMYHMALPVFTIASVGFGGWAWITRNVVLGQLQEDYVMAARAKGVPERKVLYGHVLRASAPPIATMILGALIGSLGGAIITEVVFNWPGMGRLYWTAVAGNDVPVLLGNTMVGVGLFLGTMILVDIIYVFLDPRVRVGAMGPG